jgi:colanic acid/amylovoran biosynthesis protein
VLWADNRSANLGVRVLAEGSAELARRAWGPDIQLSFQDFAENEQGFVFSRMTMQRDLFRRQGVIKQFLRGFDVIVDTGAGDSFTDIYGLKRFVVMNYAQRTAIKLGIPLVMGPQTVGPFNSLIARILAPRVIRGASVLTTRDSVSGRAAKGLGRVPDAVGTDVVFTLESGTRTKTRDVIFNVSGLLWNPNPHVNSDDYQNHVISLVAALRNQGRRVSLLAHVIENPSADNDVPALAAVNSRFDGELELIVPTSLLEAREAVASASLVIGSRMHACLNALSVGTPAFSWAYSRKFAPLLDDIGWDWGLDLRSSTDPVQETLDAISAKSEAVLEENIRAVLTEAASKLDTVVRSFSVSVPR